MVYPSGAARATASEPMAPLAPARLSITTGCPNASLSLGPINRTTTSSGPGGNGTTTVIGRVGQPWAPAPGPDIATANIVAAKANKPFIPTLRFCGKVERAVGHFRAATPRDPPTAYNAM